MGRRKVDDAGQIRERLRDPGLHEELRRRQRELHLEVPLAHYKEEGKRGGPRSRADG